MKKNLFLTCALALFAAVGVSAQGTWCRTLATGTAGELLENNQYRAETALIQNAGATGVRYTVMQTGSTNQIKGGGPTFALGELIVLDAAGDTISYTVTTNADHNTMGGAGNDGAGMPALNDGDISTYFHSTWSASAPSEYHYIELTFEKSVDAFKFVWYTRPSNANNRPLVIGLTNPGVTFTEGMLFAEYGFELAEKVTTDADIAAGGTFAFFVEGPTEFGETEGNGNTFISLSGYATGKNNEAGPQTMVQFIPGTEAGKFVLYQPVLGTYYANPDRWTDGYNGKNGWLRAYTEGWTLGQFNITALGNGDFEITTEITRQYVDGAWVNYDDPLTVWVGYDMRGSLKIFPESEKNLLEAGNYDDGAFHLPVDFGFEIYRTVANEEMVPDKTVAQMCEEVLRSVINTANDKQEEYAEIVEAGYDWVDAAGALNDAIAAANAVVEAGDLAGAFEAKSEIEAAIATLVAQKTNYYDELYWELEAEYNENYTTPPFNPSDSGKYTETVSKPILDQIATIYGDIQNNYADYSYSQIEAKYVQIESLIEQFKNSTLTFSEFPEIVSDIPNNNFKYSDLPNNAVWEKNVNLVSSVNGIRLTFLDRHIGSAGDSGNFPMIALGEIKLYDAEGNEVTLAAENFEANYTETNEGFESTVARLCDGNFAAQGYYHSPWSGAEPQEYIWIDIEFPSAMDAFTIEVYSRDKTTSNGQISLFPKKVAITEANVAYDPLLFAENPYKVYVGEKVTDPSQITADGLYVIRGLLNTQAVWKEVTEGEGEDAVTTIKQVDAEGAASYYHGVSRFHTAAAAVRAAGVYRFVPNSDGTFKALSLGLGKYWPSTEATGFVSENTVYEAAKAANLNIVASNNVDGAFVMYETIDGLTTEIAAEEEGGEPTVYNTPYVVFMDWYSGLATRPVKDPQPVVTSATLADNWGDNQCFNKANGEGEWEIYKVTMDNPDFYYLTNLTGVFEQLGLVVGTNPGEVSNLGNLESVLENAQKVVADSAFAQAPAAAAALAQEIAVVTSLEKNPMVPGVYQIVSSVDFAETKALYATVPEDGSSATFGWKTLEPGNIEFYFDFQPSENAEDLVAGGTVEESQKDLIYTIRAIGTYVPEVPYYIGEQDGQSKPVDLFEDAWSDYLVLNANGSSFNLRLAGKGAGFSIHANGHGGGSGANGNIVYWDGGAGASQWYLKKVDYETSIDDLVTEGAEVVSVAYYTTAGAAVPVPVKGINIVVTTYANGVVEAKKVLVK